MTTRTASWLGASVLLVGLLACGGGGGYAPPNPPAPVAPSVPVGLAAQGSLRKIRLTWSASTGNGLLGYNVYRSPDGSVFTKINPSLVSATTYDDAIPSPAGDGMVYQYQVTALGGLESGPSARVQGIHGTRLPANNPAGFSTTAADSPFVTEGTVVINGGDLRVETGTKLYVADGATVDVEQGNRLVVEGLLRVVASSTAHATFTSHRQGGVLGNGEGFSLIFNGAPNHNPSDGSGTLLQNTAVTNLKLGYPGGGIEILDCAPKLFNLNVTGNSSSGACYLTLRQAAGAVIQNCAFNKMTPNVVADLRGTAFKMDHNRFRGGFYAIYFGPLNNPGVVAGQIEANDFDGTQSAVLFFVTGTSAVPLGGNHWNGGTGSPPLPAELNLSGGSTVHFDFGAALASAPANAGPNWQ